MTLQTSPVFVFDLDGTVLTVNSFPYWTRYLLRGGLRSAPPTTRARVAFATAAAVVERKLARRPHGLFKQRLQQVWARHQTAEAGDEFAGQLVTRLAPQLRPLVAMMKSGQIDALLATAAAEEYVVALAGRLGFRNFVATPRGLAQSQENVGAAKRTSVENSLARLHWSGRPLVVFTDHLEDSPLIDAATRLVWCGTEDDARHIARGRPDLPMLWTGAAQADEVSAFALAAA